jgi:hypothetical protein
VSEASPGLIQSTGGSGRLERRDTILVGRLVQDGPVIAAEIEDDRLSLQWLPVLCIHQTDANVLAEAGGCRHLNKDSDGGKPYKPVGAARRHRWQPPFREQVYGTARPGPPSEAERL